MGNSSGGLTATDISIWKDLQPKNWPSTPEGAKDVSGYLFKQGFYGNKPPLKDPEYIGDLYDVNKPDIQPAGLAGADEDYPSEDEDTYQDNAPPAPKRAKGDPGPGQGTGLAGAVAGGAAIAAAAGGHGHPPPPPPPPAGEDQSNKPGTATGLNQTRTATVTETETTKEPEMEATGSGASSGSHSPMERTTRPHIDIQRGEGNSLKCTISIKRKIVIQSDENPFKRYEIKNVKIHTEFPLVSKKNEQEYKNYTEWNLKLVNSGWKTVDLNSWANWLDYPLYNYMMNNVQRFRVESFHLDFTDVYIRDIIKQENNRVEYDMTEDGRLLVLVDHQHHVPYYSSTGYAPFGHSCHEPFDLWDFWYPIFDEEYKSPFYYFEYSPFMEMVGPKGTSMSYFFEGGHWKDLRIFRNPLFYRGHRWHLAAEKKDTEPYKSFNLGPEIAIEGAQYNSITASTSRHDHPSIVDYTNNKGDDAIGFHDKSKKNTTPIQGPNDYYNFSKDQSEGNDFYQLNDTSHSFLAGKSKGNFHDGWGQRTQQYIEDTDTEARRSASVSYTPADEHLVNWKIPNPGVATHGETFVMNGPIWHCPHEFVAFPRGLGACSPIPQAPPQVFVKVKDQYSNTTSYRNQMANFDVEGRLVLEFETRDSFNPLIFNQIPDEYVTIPGGAKYDHTMKAGTASTYDSPFLYWQDEAESNKVFRGNIYYPQ